MNIMICKVWLQLLATCQLLTSINSAVRMPDLETIRTKVDAFDDVLQNYLLDVSGYDTIRQIYDNNVNLFQFEDVNGEALAKQIAVDIGKTLGKKMEALERSVSWAEDLAANYTWNSDLSIDTVNYVHAKRISEDDPDYTYDEQFKQKVNFNASSVHIPVEIYEGDLHILNGLEWSKNLDEQWLRNKEQDPNLLWQYFGSQEGIMRNFPASRWRGKGVDLYDVRRRPWYTQGASSPKDMLILVDTSGSTHGQALALTKHAVQSLLDTLGDNDFVNVAQFSDEAKWVGCFSTFVQANYRNKKVLSDYVYQLKAKNMASYNKAFQFAFEELEKYDNYTRSLEFNETEHSGHGTGANCNRIIMMLTDGGTEMPEEIFERYNPEKRVRIFTYAIGPTANPVAAVRWIACSNRGYFARIPAMGAIRSTVQNYHRALSQGLVHAQSQNTSWARTYVDFWGLGMMTTVTLPVYNKTEAGANQTILGVMGCDVTVQEMEDSIPHTKLGPNGYVFAINNNGYIIFHPFLKAQGGWLEDPPNVDLLDIEYETEAKLEMRRAMIDGEDGSAVIHTFVDQTDEMHVDNTSRTYFYTSINSSSFSLGLVIPSYVENYVTSTTPIDQETGLAYLTSLESDVLIAPWAFCGEVEPMHNESTPYDDLMNELQTDYGNCNETMTQYMFTDAKLTAEMHGHWESTNLDGVEAAFVATSGGITRVYPAGNEDLFADIADPWAALYYKRALDNADAWMYSAKYHTGKNVDVNASAPLVMAAKSLQFADRSYKYGVVGLQLQQQFLRDKIKSQLPSCYTDSNIVCYMLDDGAFLIYSSNEQEDAHKVGMFLGDFDLLLMRQLYEKSVYLRKEMYDFQAYCEVDTGTVDAAPRALPLPVIFEVLNFSWWSSKFAWLYMNFNLYSWLSMLVDSLTPVLSADEDVSDAEQPIQYTSCIKHLAQYYFHTDPLHTDNKARFTCGNCTRTFISVRMARSNLLFVMVNKNCGNTCDTTPMLQRPVESPDPGFVDGSCSAKIRYRKRPDGCYDYDEYEDNSDCSSATHLFPSTVLILLSAAATIYTYHTVFTIT